MAITWYEVYCKKFRDDLKYMRRTLLSCPVVNTYHPVHVGVPSLVGKLKFPHASGAKSQKKKKMHKNSNVVTNSQRL